ncbi:ZIP family metal transporter [Fluviicola taffensis]|uniref:Zinc/iron permease n=1 Tax=Fluviicola taffensis (strain DSM 16823 / NCIMB 13979 / RW262) TaxID=755732 RepID=F2IAU2_FLUTR|nr:ZIP family metal transporter [Fluviicola taffensis]AEA44247.1 zinc/iron permease [Fluviicola taffensis DSM 16823]
MSELILIIFFLILSVVVGGLLVVFLEKKNQAAFIKLSLAFSGGFLLAIAFIHFLPELYAEQHTKIGIWVLVGFLVQLFLEYFSGGIEHGHIHAHANKKIPYGLLISLSIHSFIEGIPLANNALHNHNHEHLVGNHQNSLLLGIILHQLPVAIALMTLLRKSLIKSSTSWLLLIIFGMMTPLGLIFGKFIPMSDSVPIMDILLAIVVGMFLHISTTIIFETNENHRFNLAKLTAILLGVGLSIGLI